jgi:hypothetical protein
MDWLRPGGSHSLAGLAAAVAIWVLTGTTVAQPSPDVTLWIPGDSVPADDAFALVIESSTPAHRGIAFPSAADSVFGDLEVLDRSDVYTHPVGSGYAIDSVSYTVTTSARDSVRIPPVPIRVDAAAGTLTTYTVPRTVPVAGQRDESSSGAQGEKASGRSAWWWALTAVVAAMLGGGAYLWREARTDLSSRTESAPVEASAGEAAPPSPHETATRRLGELQSSDLSTPDAVESFYVTLADVLRTYLSRRWDLTTEERTTQELMTLLDRHADVPAAATEQLRRVLEQTDRVKFAGARPDSSAAADALETARTALDDLEAASSRSDPDPSVR